jgi:exopolysaccharide biosynthesis predicted pyruvyltransferase EpsI
MKSIPDHDLVEKLSAEIDRVLASLIPAGTRVALINFPNHANAGDPALWLGELASLRRIGARIFYRASWASYRAEDLARVLRANDVILLHGGGNFGDLYLHNQAVTRLRVLESFPRHRTIQLPQSIWFRDDVNRNELRDRCQAHRDFTLLVREQQSLDLARRHFDVPTLLCPDMVFALGPRPRREAPRVDILWLARRDVESSGYAPPVHEPDIEVVDWLQPLPDEPPARLDFRLAMHLNQKLHPLAQNGTATPWQRWLLGLTFATMAEGWTERGCRILARGRVVVTDRLHGHILALLQGIPHVMLDNSYGKLRTIYDTWTKHSNITLWSSRCNEAIDKARALAATQREKNGVVS